MVFPGSVATATAEIVNADQQHSWSTAQLDVRLQTGKVRPVVESFGGFGSTAEAATRDALMNFAVNSFHVLAAAFFDRADEKQVTREDWTVGGRPARVTIGGVGIRGSPPVDGKPLLAWFDAFADRLRAHPLRPGVHWLRVYYAQMQHRPTVCEILLDNDVWEDMVPVVEGLPWVSGEEFYSLRLFMVVEVTPGGDVSPQTAVEWLADIIAGWDGFEEHQVYRALADAGIAARAADRAYKFTQTAWARGLLAGVGVRFPPEYACFDANGDVIESGILAEEPSFAAAATLAPRFAGTPGFRQLALMSADVNAVNQALNAGSKPENLVMSPAFLFLDPPTPAGMEKAQREVRRRLGPADDPS